MSEDMKKNDGGNGGARDVSTPVEQKTIELKITMGPRGIQVHGPLRDDILCYGLLEKARMIVTSYNMKVDAQERKIVRPKGGMINFVRGKK